MTWRLDSAANIARRISDYRAIRGMTVEEVARRSGVQPQVVRCLERSGVTPTTNRDAVRVAKTLSIPFTYLNAAKGSHG